MPVPAHGSSAGAASNGVTVINWRAARHADLHASRRELRESLLAGAGHGSLAPILRQVAEGVPAEMAQIPWDGPHVRIVEHQAHALCHAALLIEERGVLVAGDIDVVVPGHGAVGGADHARIDQDRGDVHALRDGQDPSDRRIGSSAKPGREWVSNVHTGNYNASPEKSERGGTPG